MNAPAPTFPNSKPPPTRVRVAEDDERSRAGLVRLLERDGNEVTVADDGQAAINILLSPDPPQVALLLWEMPRLDGIHVCWDVRSMPAAAVSRPLRLEDETARMRSPGVRPAWASEVLRRLFMPLIPPCAVPHAASSVGWDRGASLASRFATLVS
jgi:CheY-like chemotaxis protein